MARFAVGDDELTSRNRHRKRKQQAEASRVNKKPHTNIPDSDSDDDGDEMEEGKSNLESVGDSDTGATVRIDLDVLDCAICFDPLTPPIFQCRNGHVACSTCSSKIGNKCHSCYDTTGYSRCLALEKVIESIKLPCSNAEYGCKQTFSYIQKHTHEEMCIHAPCFCPVPICSFHGSTSMLSAHFSRDHNHFAKPFWYDRPFKVSFDRNEAFLVLHAEDGHMFILSNCDNEPYGRALSVACIRSGTRVCDFSYELTASCNGSTLQVKSSTPSIHKTTFAYRGNVFLMVPIDFFSCRKIFLDVCIQKIVN